jgi:hypothetical protein
MGVHTGGGGGGGGGGNPTPAPAISGTAEVTISRVRAEPSLWDLVREHFYITLLMAFNLVMMDNNNIFMYAGNPAALCHVSNQRWAHCGWPCLSTPARCSGLPLPCTHLHSFAVNIALFLCQSSPPLTPHTFSLNRVFLLVQTREGCHFHDDGGAYVKSQTVSLVAVFLFRPFTSYITDRFPDHNHVLLFVAAVAELLGLVAMLLLIALTPSGTLDPWPILGLSVRSPIHSLIHTHTRASRILSCARPVESSDSRKRAAPL